MVNNYTGEISTTGNIYKSISIMLVSDNDGGNEQSNLANILKIKLK